MRKCVAVLVLRIRSSAFLANCSFYQYGVWLAIPAIIIGFSFRSDVGIETLMSDRAQEPVSASEDDTVTNPANT